MSTSGTASKSGFDISSSMSWSCPLSVNVEHILNQFRKVYHGKTMERYDFEFEEKVKQIREGSAAFSISNAIFVYEML